MATFQIVSDLHLENPAAYDIFEIPPCAPYLALLGDIGVVKDDKFFAFIEAQLPKFEIVFFLLGNHEPWYSSWGQTRQKLAHFSDLLDERRSSQSRSTGKFVFLDQTQYDLSPTLTVLGCTLYSRVSETHREDVSFGINDFYHIDDWTVDDHCVAHEADLKWLNEQVTSITACEPQRTIVIFTHYSPVTSDARAVDPRHMKSPLSSGFATDLSAQECWTNPRVRLWAFGHTHYNTHYTDEETGKLVVSNQRGYYFSQANGFDATKSVQV
ncbi:hypothetical protein N7492_007229 [Penicillium capsulatum]|uniref:Calcineurin-like phosphoesterase domain-containing protein n=1 Tax=Penicillium capsulatum TaxID=69766 RepID=A0A9W9LKL7_9EURO|nr:hypothetical protein N7492_007229 [Penicillium capsulatum]KAJ6117067.1 hypothetical protein N7512_006792 [Penicillium capsulatum]